MPQFRTLPAPDGSASPPGWTVGILEFDPLRSSAIGAAIGAATGRRRGNGAETRQRGGQSKELRRAVGTGVAASSARVPSADVPGAIPVFVVLACLGVALPIVTMFVRGVRTDVVLNERTTGLTCNNTTMTQINYRFSGTFPIGMDLDQV